MGRIILHPSTKRVFRAAKMAARSLMCKCGHRLKEHNVIGGFCRTCERLNKNCDDLQPIGEPR